MFFLHIRLAKSKINAYLYVSSVQNNFYIMTVKYIRELQWQPHPSYGNQQTRKLIMQS